MPILTHLMFWLETFEDLPVTSLKSALATKTNLPCLQVVRLQWRDYGETAAEAAAESLKGLAASCMERRDLCFARYSNRFHDETFKFD